MNPVLPAPGAPAVPPPSGRSRHLFTDIDEQAAALTGWNQRYQQLSAGVFRGAVQRLQLDGVGLFVEDLHQAVHQTGQVRPQVVALGVPAQLHGDSLFCGQPGDAAALYVFSGRDGFEFRSPQRHVMLGIEIDAPLFESEVLGTRAVSAPGSFAARAGLLAGDAAAIGALRCLLLSLFSAAPGGLAHPPTPAAPGSLAVRDELLRRLATAIEPAGAADRPQPAVTTASSARVTLADRAHQLVSERLDDPPTVGELCIQLGVSRRTLQNSVHATWGMGPLAWLNTLRLNAVRQRLKTAASVTDAATAYGFWHFGHFADEYRALFGELPSQTLRRHRAAAAAFR